MANNKYNSALAVLLNNGSEQILPVSKAQLIELANSQQNGQFGDGTKDVAGALTYLLNKGNSDIAALDGFAKSNTGYVLSYIVEEDGIIRTQGEQTWLDASVVSYQGGEGAGAPTTVQEAIEKIQTTLSSLAGEGEGSVQTQIANAINGLDVAAISETGKPIVSVSQSNGYVSATAGNIAATYVEVDNQTLGWDIDGDTAADSDVTVQSAITYLQNEINALDADAKEYQIITTTGGANVKERKQLQVKSGNGSWSDVANSYVDIYKDSALADVFIGHTDDSLITTSEYTNKATSVTDGTGATALCFVYHKEDGNYELVTVANGDFLVESEFDTTKALSVNDHVVGVKVKSDDPYIEIDATNGIQSKTSAIDSNIDTRINSYVGTNLHSEIGRPEAATAYVITGVVEENGLLSSYSGVELIAGNVKTNLTDDDALWTLAGGSEGSNPSTDVSDVKSALNLLASNVTNLSGGTLGAIAITDGEYIKATNEGKNGTTYSFTIDDSALGNVATLSYTELTWSGAETITILGANPEE